MLFGCTNPDAADDGSSLARSDAHDTRFLIGADDKTPEHGEIEKYKFYYSFSDGDDREQLIDEHSDEIYAALVGFLSSNPENIDNF